MPTVTDWDKDHVDLKWTPPKTDGGSPITGYVVEKKDKFGNWEKAVEVPAGKTACTVPDLTEGQTYEFRVRAVNEAGPGEPSESTHPITAKPRNMAPKIDRTNLEPIKIKAGMKFGFDVKACISDNFAVYFLKFDFYIYKFFLGIWRTNSRNKMVPRKERGEVWW